MVVKGVTARRLVEAGVVILAGILVWAGLLLIRSPPPPILPTPTRIVVKLVDAPFLGPIGPSQPVEIPASELDFVARLIAPGTWLEGGKINVRGDPLVAIATVTGSDGSIIDIAVHWSGKNP